MDYYVNVYETGRAFGGSEEGGWYYDFGTRVSSRRITSHRKALRVLYRLENKLKQVNQEERRINGSQSNGTGDYLEGCIENYPAPEYFPVQRPRYE